MATALSRRATRPHAIRQFLRFYGSIDSRLPPVPYSSGDVRLHGPSSSFLRSIFPVNVGIQRSAMDRRCLFNSVASHPSANTENVETKSSDAGEKSEKSKSSDGGEKSGESKSSDGGEKSGESKSSDGGNKSGGSSQSSSDSGKSVRGGPVSWMSFLLLLATGAGLIFYYDREKKQHIEDINNASKAVKEGPSAGKAAIGGPFSLLRDDGKRVTEKDFMGKWSIVYFGFTHCPDICPDELVKLSAAVDKIKEKSGTEIVPVFISVDPERDTVEQVREYVKEFHPKLVGLTGTPEEIKSVARSYRVYYMKTDEEDSDYLVDHSIVMYLMSPTMDFVKFYGKNHDVDSLTDGVIKEIKQYKK